VSRGVDFLWRLLVLTALLALRQDRLAEAQRLSFFLWAPRKPSKRTVTKFGLDLTNCTRTFIVAVFFFLFPVGFLMMAKIPSVSPFSARPAYGELIPVFISRLHARRFFFFSNVETPGLLTPSHFSFLPTSFLPESFYSIPRLCSSFP